MSHESLHGPPKKIFVLQRVPTKRWRFEERSKGRRTREKRVPALLSFNHDTRSSFLVAKKKMSDKTIIKRNKKHSFSIKTLNFFNTACLNGFFFLQGQKNLSELNEFLPNQVLKIRSERRLFLLLA